MQKSLRNAFLFVLLAASPAMAQVGIFENQADWDLDDGTKVPGTATFADGTYTLEGNGADIWGTNDEGFFLYNERPTSESWQLSGRVQWIDHGTNDWAKIGLMVRSDAEATGSSNIFMVQRGLQDLIRASFRPAVGADSNDAPMLDADGNEIPADAVYFRVGYWAPMGVVFGEYSIDGSTWDHALTSTLPNDGDLAYGIAITNHENDDALAVAEANEVTFEELTEMPAFLDQGGNGEFDQSVDVGAFNLAGESSFSDGLYSVIGGGGDIWDNNDQFHFLYKEMTGSFEIAGEIFPLAPSSNLWTKGGFMVRKDLGAASPNGFALLRQDGAFRLQSRINNGDNTGGTDIGLAPLDATNGSYRLVKVGNLVEAYYGDIETDEWVSVGSATIDLNETFLVGLAVTSHEHNQLSTFEFNNLQITEYPYEVVRTVSSESFFPNDAIDVTLTVNVREGETVDSLTITEVVPAEAASIGGISEGGSLSGDTITWELSGVSDGQTLSYTVFAPGGTNTVALNFGESTASGAGFELPVGGPTQLGALTFNSSESFSYPDGQVSNSFEGEPVFGRAGGVGWGDENAWTEVGDTPQDVILNTNTLDAGMVLSQPTAFNPGNYSLELSGEVGGGASRMLPVNMTGGELWISYTFMDEADPTEVFSGISFYDNTGTEVAYIGKPWSAEFLGIGNLPDGDVLTDVPYTEPNHILARIVINGDDSAVYMWVNPDKEDRMDTYDASGPDSIGNIAEFRIRRGNANVAGTSAFYDNMWFSTVPALPPAGAGRVDLQIDDPNRPAELPAWDVISMDQVDDAENVTGLEGFGHDNGEDHFLIVSGFIYFTDLAGQTGQVVASGLPPDRMSGLNGHILGPFNNAIEAEGLKNAMKFENNEAQSGPFTFDLVPAGNYRELRSAQTVANGDGRLFATLNYDDGTSEDTFLNADDWFNDGDEVQFENTRLLVDGMNRLSGDNSFDDRFDPAVFECFIPVNPDKVLTSVTLEFDGTEEVSAAGAAYNLFDIWALPAGATSVDNWALY